MRSLDHPVADLREYFTVGRGDDLLIQNLARQDDVSLPWLGGSIIRELESAPLVFGDGPVT
ncbi:hypothetical protein C6A86_023575 [Mycobacterium sp. ITM-2016-00316]|uniref:hypothetical protein n=1 Tax=Mycobacterium sp. ITM-2016-00316 TaxID=2099695 RepID=UPI000CFA67A6|nr:hypothetical protein [Mycobacterium sp. ITM-2016-00316]WNG81142.1 hypothetical protein C6A86_023575 [Mycobacterium sp. ITM-2016-00316]